jgi:hypothetical protein
MYYTRKHTRTHLLYTSIMVDDVIPVHAEVTYRSVDFIFYCLFNYGSNNSNSTEQKDKMIDEYWIQKGVKGSDCNIISSDTSVLARN